MIKQLRQQGAMIVDIAHQIGCSERTVQRYLALPAPPTGRPSIPKPSKLDPFKPYIDQQLADNVWNAEVIFQQVKALGYPGGISLVRQYIQPKRALRPSKKTVRFETQPGQQLQHDWGEVVTHIAGQRCTISLAVNALGYSRRFHVWVTQSQDAEHTYESLVQAFAYFGGVPKTVLVDNQKAAVLKHTPSRTEFNEGFLQLAHHYGFVPRACKPRRARTKGKVERMVGYVKHNFFERYRAFESLAHVNQLLMHWLQHVADERVLRQFEQTPQQRFVEECLALQALPPSAFDTSYRDMRQVSWDGYIEVRGNRYTVPTQYCGQGVSIRIGLSGQLRVYNAADSLIATHLLRPKQQGWQSQPDHHRELWQETLNVEYRDLSVYQEVLS